MALVLRRVVAFSRKRDKDRAAGRHEWLVVRQGSARHGGSAPTGVWSSPPLVALPVFACACSAPRRRLCRSPIRILAEWRSSAGAQPVLNVVLGGDLVQHPDVAV